MVVLFEGESVRLFAGEDLLQISVSLGETEPGLFFPPPYEKNRAFAYEGNLYAFARIS